MKEMGGEGGRYRELKYEKKNYITSGFRKEKINAAAAVLHPLSIQMPEDCAVDGTKPKKIMQCPRSLSSLTEQTPRCYTQALPFHSFPPQTDLTGRNKWDNVIAL